MAAVNWETPRLGILVTDAWSGRNRTPVDVIGQSPACWRIRAITDTRLGGRARWLRAGEVARVPRRAIVFPA